MPKKPITTDDLARLIAKGFDGVEKQFRKMATKADLEELEERVRGEFATKLDLHDMEDRLTKETRMAADLVAGNALRGLETETERRLHGIEKRLGRLEKQAR